MFGNNDTSSLCQSSSYIQLIWLHNSTALRIARPYTPIVCVVSNRKKFTDLIKQRFKQFLLHKITFPNIKFPNTNTGVLQSYNYANIITSINISFKFNGLWFPSPSFTLFYHFPLYRSIHLSILIFIILPRGCPIVTPLPSFQNTFSEKRKKANRVTLFGHFPAILTPILKKKAQANTKLTHTIFIFLAFLCKINVQDTNQKC